MKAEKVYQEKTARTIPQNQDGGGTLQFIDNRPANELLQRVSDEDEDTLQGKQSINPFMQRKSNNTGLPDNLKAGVENLSGYSLDEVQVHYNSPQPSTVQALAYTQGTDIHVAPGQEQHLPHEAWHVVQQMARRVEPTTEVGSLPVNDNIALPHEADVMGSRANNL